MTLSQYVTFLPDLVARTALQDVRLQDLQAVAERKRLVWADTWKAVHANGTVDLAASVRAPRRAEQRGCWVEPRVR